MFLFLYQPYNSIVSVFPYSFLEISVLKHTARSTLHNWKSLVCSQQRQKQNSDIPISLDKKKTPNKPKLCNGANRLIPLEAHSACFSLNKGTNISSPPCCWFWSTLSKPSYLQLGPCSWIKPPGSCSLLHWHHIAHVDTAKLSYPHTKWIATCKLLIGNAP